MSSYYAYIRVSTVRQSDLTETSAHPTNKVARQAADFSRGTSLKEQRSAIEAYAARHGFRITEWFEERETAAKRGREIFERMLKLLRAGRAQGVIIHKVDRSARNLADWGDISELLDSGIDVHLAHDGVDLHTRGGRLSADIQAVVAADYSRNLREEVRKGMRGRLKQGLYPLGAPLGYKDNGGGKAKTIDPAVGPLVRQAFELYATRRYNFLTLGAELYRLGLRNRSGSRISKGGLGKLLNNEFYIGIIHIRRTGERYQGIHEPLIAKSLFDRVQSILHGKAKNRGWKHELLYRRAIECKHCGRCMTGERQKGYVYYRCHTKSCPQSPLKEEVVSGHIQDALESITLTRDHYTLLGAHIERRKKYQMSGREEQDRAIAVQLGKIDERMDRLGDAFLDQSFDKDEYQERKRRLLHKRAALLEQRARLYDDGGEKRESEEKFELIKTLSLRGFPANLDEKLDLVQKASSNLTADGKYVEVGWISPFNVLAAREEFAYGGPYQANARTVETCQICTNQPTTSDEKRASPHPDEWLHAWCEAVCDEIFDHAKSAANQHEHRAPA